MSAVELPAGDAAQLGWRVAGAALAIVLVARPVSWAAAVVGSAPQAGQARTYRARLSPLPVDGPPMMATIAGLGQRHGHADRHQADHRRHLRGTQVTSDAAKLHRGQKGVRGPAVLDLVVANTPSAAVRSSTRDASAAVELTPTQVDDLERERCLLQLHSEKAPDGNLWGWLLPQESKR